MEDEHCMERWCNGGRVVEETVGWQGVRDGDNGGSSGDGSRRGGASYVTVAGLRGGRTSGGQWLVTGEWTCGDLRW